MVGASIYGLEVGGTIQGYRPMLYAAIEALGSLPSVALSWAIALALYPSRLLP